MWRGNFPPIPTFRPRCSAAWPLITATGQGIGEFFLIDALRRAYFQSSQIAAVAVVLDAIDEQAARFYRHFEFIPLPDRPDRLFLPMKTIAALFTRT